MNFKKRLIGFFLAFLMMFTLFVPVAMAAGFTVTGGNDAKTGKITLSWKTVSNAKKYEVYRSASKSGTYSKYTTTTKTSYTNTNAVAGNTYYYTVKAIDKSGKVLQTSSVVSRTCDCARPTVTATNNDDGKVTLKWSAITGAKKYEVYRATSQSGKYTKLGTTTKTTYTNTSMTVGSTYYYKVKAISSKTTDADSAYSTVVSRMCDCAKPQLKVSAITETGKTALSWQKITGAKSYDVYRAASKTGSFTKLTNTTDTSYNDTSAVVGRTYYYKVKALAEKSTSANSVFSDVKSRTCDCAMLTNVAVDYEDDGSIIFTWDKVSGATGYKVMRANTEDAANAGKYELIATVTECTYTDQEAKAGQYFYYRLIAVSSKSKYADSEPVDGPALPLYAKPGNLRDKSTSTQTRIMWDRVSGVDGYVILRGKTDNLEEMEPLAGVTMLRNWYYDDGVYHGYYYCVIGVKDMGEDNDPIPTVPAIVYVK